MVVTFWIFWSITLVACLNTIWRCWHRPERLVEWEFIFVGLFLYVYVYTAYPVATTLRQFVDDRDLFIGALFPMLSLLFGVYGWRRAIRGVSLNSLPRTTLVSTVGNSSIFWVGIAFLAIGLFGSYKTSVAVLREQGVFTEKTSGYIYLIFYLGYAGMMLSLLHLYTKKVRFGSALWIVYGISAFLFMLPAFIHQQRSPFFAFIAISAFSFYLLKRRKPNPVVMFGGFFLVGFIMLFMFQVRLYTTNNMKWTEALKMDTVSQALVGRSQRVFDNEYLNNCQLIGAIWESGKYDYGTGHLSMPLNAIPRQIWNEKPSIGVGIIDPKQEIYPIIQGKYRVTLLGYGASAAGVADTFLQYGIFTPLFFGFYSYLVGICYRKFISTQRETYFLAYVGFLATSQFLVLQQFSQVVVPFCFFVVPSVAALLLCRDMFPGTRRVESLKVARRRAPAGLVRSQPT